MTDTNGTTTPDAYNWESLVTTLLAVAGSVVAIINPGGVIPVPVQSLAVAIAGIMTMLHVHMPKVVAHLFQTLFPLGSTGTPEPTPQEQALLNAVRAVVAEQAARKAP